MGFNLPQLYVRCTLNVVYSPYLNHDHRSTIFHGTILLPCRGKGVPTSFSQIPRLVGPGTVWGIYGIASQV